MNPRKIAFDVLKGILRGSRRGGPILFEFREQFLSLDPKDGALTERIVKGILEKEILLERLVKEIAGVSYRHLDRNLKILLKMGLYQLLFLDRVPDYAAINETVSLTRELFGAKASGYANWFLREAQRKKKELILKSQAQGNGGILREIPKWLTDHLREEIGLGQIERLLKSKESPPIGLRVNTLKISREELLKRLKDMGTEAKPSLISPHGISLERHQLKKIKGEILESGIAQVQSEASQLAAFILRPLPGQRILDLCSGLGTKAFHMAQLMEDKGEIISVDIDLSRLRELKRTGERLGVSIVQPICADATLGLSALIRGGFDRILLDAPCSNLGALGRKRELIFRLSPKRIENLAQLQLRLLKNAKILLNPMGYLLYVTCTVSRIENEENVERFLASEPDMELVSPKSNFGLIPDELVKVPGFVKTFPHMEGTDGFFYALFRKRKRG